MVHWRFSSKFIILIIVKLLEIRSAVANGKRLIFVRDVNFTIPKPLPPHAADLEHLLHEYPVIDYMAEFYSQFMQKLRKEIGPSDSLIKEFEQENPKFVEQVKSLKVIFFILC